MTDLRIASPCHESWDAMTPDGRGRHCAACAKTVIDVTAMAPDEGRAFVARELPARLSRGERVCVRAHADPRGQLLRPGIRRYLLTNGLAAMLALSLAGCGEPVGPTVGDVGPEQPENQPATGGGGEVPRPILGETLPPEPVVPLPLMGKPCIPAITGAVAPPPIRGEVAPEPEGPVTPAIEGEVVVVPPTGSPAIEPASPEGDPR
jgi:hypothetical protein